MPLLDKAISFISPRWSAERKMWRQVENSYKGGVPTRTSETWQTNDGMRFGNSVDRQQQLVARDRAYHAYKNNPIARTLVDTETDNVIGDGLNYKPTTDSPAWNKEAKDRYYDWLENVSVRGTDIHTGCELQRLYWDRSRVAGDAGLLLVNGDYINPDTGVPTVRSQLQLVQAERIVTPDGRFTAEGVYDGIRYNDVNRPVEFYLKSQDQLGRRDFKTIFARDFVWLPHMTDSEQARGETCFLTIFDLLAHLDRYVDGVSLAAWMATVFGIIFKQNNAGRQLSSLSTTLSNSAGDPQKAIVFENGMFKYVGTDEDVAQVQAHQPMQQTPEFIRAMFRMLGQPFGMPLEVIAKDMSTCNFASARIGLLPFYRTCRIKAARFGSRWSRVIRWWLSRERARAANDPNRWDNEFPKDFFRHDLLINAWEYTDPVSEAQADLLQMSMLTKSPQMVIAERGRDAEQIVAEFVEWLTKTGQLPKVFSTMTRDPAPEPVAPAQPDQEAPTDPVKAYARAFRDILAMRSNGEINGD